MKTRLIFVTVLIVLLSACAPTSMANVPNVCLNYDTTSADYELCLKDPGAYEMIQQAERSSAMATQQAQATPAPKATPMPTPTMLVLSTEWVSCDQAISGDSIGSMAIAAWNGKDMPSYYLNGLAMQVAVYSEGDPEIYKLQDLFDTTSSTFVQSPDITVGQWICLSVNPEKLKNYDPGD